MSLKFIDQCFKMIDQDEEHRSTIHEIDHMIETFKVREKDFDDVVSATIGELYSRNEDPLLADLSKQQALDVYEALSVKFG